jgi:hypothetical protein
MEMNGKNLKYFFLGAFVVAAGFSVLAAVNLPHTFKAGDPIKSSEVNENFAALKQAVETLQGQVGSLSSQQSTLDGRVSGLEQFKQGLPTAKGFPRVYAFIKSDGTIERAWSSTGANLSVSHPSSGIYIVKYSDNNGQIYGTPAFVTPYNSPAACDSVPFNDFIEVDCYGTGVVNDTKSTDTAFFLLVLNP